MSTPTARQLQERILQANAALLGGRGDEVLEIVDTSIPAAEDGDLLIELGLLHTLRGEALMGRRNGDRAADIEDAITSLEIAVRLAPDPGHRANVAVKLAVAYSERLRGNPDENAENAVRLMRATLDELPANVPVGFPAHLKASLAIALTRRRMGVHADNLCEAVGLLGEAVALVTPQDDLENWAHRQINLANALLEMALEGEAEIADAVVAFGALVRQGERLIEAGRSAQLGYAHFGLGVARRHLSDDFFDSGAAAEWEATGALESIDPRLLEALAGASEHLETACRLFERGSVEAGWSFAQLATTRGRLGDEDGSLEAGRLALEGLKPTVAPGECLRVGKALGELQARRGEWEGAADAFRRACAASELRFFGTRDLNQREAESHEATSLARWAAHAIARWGDPLEAVMVLESARTREQRLRRGTEDDPMLATLPGHIREAYVVALSDLAAAPLGPLGAAESRRLVEVIEAIRSRPGFERFAMGVAQSALESAVEPGFPLVYINPTPYGTVLLEVGTSGDEIEATSTFLDSPLGSEVLERLGRGDAAAYADPADFKGEVVSYLHAIGAFDKENEGEEDDIELAVSLDEILPWLGEQIAGPLCQRLEHLGARGVTLIPCGVLALAPLHAASWLDEKGDPTCLLERLEVRYAPSAHLMAMAQGRLGAEARAARLVALGNPDSGDPDLELPSAEAEVAAIATFFDSQCDTTATGVDATWDFLVQHVGGATNVHLACHAKGGTAERADTGIYLYDDFIPAHVLGALPNFDARLVVVSACQSAISDTVTAPEEVFSITTALLGAGCSGVIASLWPVSDVSTAILMTRFYQELLTGGVTPSAALRAAALWLRGLTEGEERQFLAAHPALEAEVSHRARQGNRAGRRGSADTVTMESHRPYAEPEYWAPFIIAGL